MSRIAPFCRALMESNHTHTTLTRDLVSASCIGKWYVHCVRVSCKHQRKVCPFASILQRHVFPSGTFRVSKLQAVRVCVGVCVAIAWGAVEAISEATFAIIELTKRPRISLRTGQWSFASLGYSDVPVLWVVISCSMQLSQETHHSSRPRTSPWIYVMTC